MIIIQRLTTIVGLAAIPNPYTNQKIAPKQFTNLRRKTSSIRNETNTRTVPMYPNISQLTLQMLCLPKS